MVDKYWVGGAGSWTTTSTTNWSLLSGGVGGAPVPSASDNVFFDQAGTYTVTCTGALTCRDFTVSLGVVSFALSGSSSVAISGSMTLASGTVGTWTANFAVTFNATTSKTITTNNEPIGATTFNGVGGTWTLGSAFSINSGAIDLDNGTFSTSASNYSINCGIFRSSGTTARTLNLNASTFTLTSSTWNCPTSTNLTVSGSGATVTMTSASAKTFAGGSANWSAITLNQGGSGQLTISGSNTFANISNSYNATGATSIRFTSGTTQTVTSFTAEGTSGKVLTIDSTTPATAATLSKTSGTVSVNYVSIQDSTATGGAAWNALDSTNVSGNTGWVFALPIRYWVGGTGTWDTSSTTNWSTSSGGASGASVPTAANNVFFDQVGTYTVTVTGALACLDFTVSAGIVTFALGTTPTLTISGDMSLASGTVGTWDQNFNITFNATTSKTITTNNESLSNITFNGVGGTWTLGSALTTPQDITLTNGTFSTSASNYAVSSANFSSNNANTRTLNVNASTFTVTSSWTCTTATGLTVSGSGATVTMTGASAKTFAGGSFNWGAITLDQGGAGALTISGSNTFANISNSYNATAATIIRFTSGTTQTITSFTAEGTAGKVLIIDSTTPATAATLSKTSGTVSVNYVSIQDSTATGGAVWEAGFNSTDVSGNTGWIFLVPPPVPPNTDVTNVRLRSFTERGRD